VGAMFSIPTIIIAKQYDIQVNAYCRNTTITKKNITICEEYMNRDGKDAWLQSYNCDYIKYYTRNLKEINSEFLTNTVDFSFIICLTLIVLILIKCLFVIIVDSLDTEIDMLNITPSDYTLMISNIPTHIQDKEVIIDNYLTVPNKKGKNAFEMNLKPIEINITYKIADYIKIKEEYLKLRRLIKKYELKKIFIHQPICGNEETLVELKSRLNELSLKLDKYLSDFDNAGKKLFTGVVFATFNTVKEYEAFLAFFPKSFVKYIFVLFQYIFVKFLCCCCSNTKRIQKLKTKLYLNVSPSPEPTNVLWANLEVTLFEKIVRTIICYFITFIILAISLAIILGLNVWQKKLTDEGSKHRYSVSIAVTLFLNVINQVVIKLINTLTNYERKTSISIKFLSNSIKLQMVIISFIN
jgi:hypothetical protein